MKKKASVKKTPAIADRIDLSDIPDLGNTTGWVRGLNVPAGAETRLDPPARARHRGGAETGAAKKAFLIRRTSRLCCMTRCDAKRAPRGKGAFDKFLWFALQVDLAAFALDERGERIMAVG